MKKQSFSEQLKINLITSPPIVSYQFDYFDLQSSLCITNRWSWLDGQLDAGKKLEILSFSIKLIYIILSINNLGVRPS
jgi:hypothetical protein